MATPGKVVYSTTILTLAAVIGLGAVVTAGLVVFQARALLIERATSTASQHARVMASHTEQSFKAVEILLDVLATDLRGRDLGAIPEDAGRDMLRTRMSGALAQLRNMSIMDADGRQLFLSSAPIGGAVTVADRDYFQQIKLGAKTASSGPYVGRNSARPTYALARRIEDLDGTMTGLAHAAVQPEFFVEFCGTVQPTAKLQTALVSATGAVVATCDQGNPFVAQNLADLPQFSDHAGPPLLSIPAIRIVHGIADRQLQLVVFLEGRDIGWAWRWELLSAALLAAIILGVSATVVVTMLHHHRRTHHKTAQELALLEQRVAKRTHQLEKAKGAAEQANLAKSRFLAAASHDLRQPAQSIFLFLAVLAEQVADHPARVTVSRLDQSMRALQGLLDGILDISKLDAGVVEPQLSATALAPILSALGDEYGPRATEKGGRLRIVVPRHLCVATDDILLGRLLRNLIENAVRYANSGKILVGCRRRDDGVRVDVIDAGPGIAADHREAIFEEFYQIGNAARDRRLGLGLGLAIVRRLAKILGHTIELDSVPGRGSRFSFWLPLATTVVPSAEEHREITHLAGRRVLVIEDDALVQDGLRTMLESRDMDVTVAGSQSEALATLHTPPDIMVVDYRLRDGESGIDAARAVRRALAAATPFIVITGDTASDRILEFAQADAIILHKPVDGPRLLRALDMVLAGKRAAGGQRVETPQ